ncbi:MAG TPA: hypothetical protein VEP49_21455 [Acidimicrobiia bacterium]|nr:hypothetical protein [Acidimicrobiia bacterium]
MLFAGTPEQADAALRAMRSVATAGGTRPLTDADRVALVTAHDVIFRGDGSLDPDALDAITPGDLAARYTKRADAEHLAGFLTVMAMVDGVLDEGRIRTVEDYVRALQLHEPFVRDLQDLARHRLAEARADIGRRNVKSFTGRWMGDDLDAWIMPYREHPDPALHDRYTTLAGCAGGTFGRAFADFYERNGFDYPGLPDSANESFTTPHDCAHVLSGYDTSPQGELLVSTFTAGMHPDEPITGHILPVIVSWHLGVELASFAGSYTGGLDPHKFWAAWARGDETAGDTLSPRWDFWARAAEPLADVRRAMRVPALDPADAADGRYPDWYEPTA